MVRKKYVTVIKYRGVKVKLQVPAEDFYTSVLLFFGEPKVDFRSSDFSQRTGAYISFCYLMDSTELGRKFTDCVAQCGGLKSQRWELYHLYVNWHAEACKRIQHAVNSRDSTEASKAEGAGS